MASAASWGVEVGPWSAPKMARSYHQALGVVFASNDSQKYIDVLLYGLTPPGALRSLRLIYWATWLQLASQCATK